MGVIEGKVAGGGEGEGDGDEVGDEESSGERSSSHGMMIHIGGGSAFGRVLTVCVALLTSTRWLTSLDIALVRACCLASEAFVAGRESGCCAAAEGDDGPGVDERILLIWR